MQKRIDFITPEEFTKLMKGTNDKELKLAMLLGFGSGLRISEIVGWERNDGSSIPKLTKDKIFLQEHQIRLDDGKGKKWRTTITPPNLSENMLNLLPLKLKRRTLQNRFQRLTLKILKKKMSFHTLRHGFANYHANILKTSLPVVQSMLGHSRLDTTGIYTKANPNFNNIWEAMQ